MKITKQQLRQIIKEELDNATESTSANLTEWGRDPLSALKSATSAVARQMKLNTSITMEEVIKMIQSSLDVPLAPEQSHED